VYFWASTSETLKVAGCWEGNPPEKWFCWILEFLRQDKPRRFTLKKSGYSEAHIRPSLVPQLPGKASANLGAPQFVKKLEARQA
jgi:hypothetical protein